MSISANNDRLTVIIPKSLKEDLKFMADIENRSVSNFVVYILEKYVEDVTHTKGMDRDSNSRS